MAVICPIGKEPLSGTRYCRLHNAEGVDVQDEALAPPQHAPGAQDTPGTEAGGAGGSTPETTCWACRKDVIPGNAWCQNCAVELPAPPLVLDWTAADRRIGVRAGEQFVLGRDETLRDASIFEDWDNVSRAQATVGVDALGHAWIRDGAHGQPSTNGTFVNGKDIARERWVLDGGDTIAFGQDPPREALVILRKVLRDGR